MPESVGELVREQEDNFIRGSTQISTYVKFSMHETLERIEAYANSRHISGDYDAQGREKPFFNIVTAAMNIWYRATDIDRKDIRFVPTNSKSVVLAFVANVILQNWMVEERFGVFLNDWGRSLSKYGSSVVKFVKNKSGLHPSVTPWGRLIIDSVDFHAAPRIEVLELTEAQLRGRIKTNGYDKDQVEALCNALKSRETVDKRKKDTKNDYIKLYEVNGEMPRALLTIAQGNEADEKEWIDYILQLQVVSYVGVSKGRTTEYADFTLYAGEEAQDPNMITHLIKEDSRTLAIGAVEHSFDSQWMTNHSKKTVKDTLDLASRLFFQTADTHFVGRNILTQIETGDVLIHAANMPLTQVPNAKNDIVSMENFASSWMQNNQEITATPDALRGTNPVSGTPYATTALITQQANSLFELMTENKGLAIEDMMRTYVIPYIKTKLKHTDEVAAILDQAGISEIDSMYIPHEAIRLYNEQTTKKAFDYIETNGQSDAPEPFNQPQAQQNLTQQLGSQGNKRFFIPDDATDATWAEVFSDFEWDSIRVEVTNEQYDKQAMLQSLNTLLTTIGNIAAQGREMTADEKMIVGTILRETGAVSQLQLSTAQAQPTPPPMAPTQTPGSMTGALPITK